MRRVLVSLTLALAVAIGFAGAALAQSAAARIVEVTLRDGSKVFGTVLSDEGGRLMLRTVGGADVTVNRDQVHSLHPAPGQIVDGDFWPDDVTTSKLFLGPTGRALHRGEGYFALDSIFLPVFQVGVTDRFSIGAGAPFFGAVKTAWVTPKFQIYRGDRTAVATGVMHLFVPGSGLGGFGYVAATHGTAAKSVTLGAGMLYGRNNEGAARSLPMITVGGEHRISRRSKFVTENYIFKEGIIATFGSRIIGPTTSYELGAIVPIIHSAPMPGFFFNVIWHTRASSR